MRMYDLIMKKRNGGVLTDQEIEYMVNGYVKGEIADYQMSAMLMSIWFKGMNDHEIGELTQVMARSGDMIDHTASSANHGLAPLATTDPGLGPLLAAARAVDEQLRRLETGLLSGFVSAQPPRR